MRKDMKFFTPWFVVCAMLMPNMAASDTNWETHRDELIDYFSDSDGEKLSKDKEDQVKAIATCTVDTAIIPTANKADCKYDPKLGAADSFDKCAHQLSEENQMVLLTNMLTCITVGLLK